MIYDRIFTTHPGRIAFFLAFMFLGSLIFPIPRVAATSTPAIEIASGINFDGVGASVVLPYPTGSGGITSGDLLIVAICTATNSGQFNGVNLTDEGFALFHDWESGDGAVKSAWYYYKVADGGEPANVSIGTVANIELSIQAFRIVGYRTGVGLNSFMAFASTDSLASAPNSPDLNPAGWDSEPTLWLTFGCMDADTGVPFYNASPSGYVTIRTDVGSGTDGTALQSAYRGTTAASENPGAFGVSANPSFWTATTIAIRAQLDPPLVTLAATGIGQDRARLNGRLDSLFSSTVTLWFEWGDTVSLGNDSSNITRSSTGTFQIIQAGLAENTTYYFRAMSEEVPSGYTGQGEILNFTTGEQGEELSFAFNAVYVFVFIMALILMIMVAWWIRSRLA